MDTAVEISGSSSAQFGASFRDGSSAETEDELELQWAAVERLPTFERLRTSLFDSEGDPNGGQGKNLIDVTELGAMERRFIVDKLISHIEEDNRRLLLKMRKRMDKVGVKLPTVEVKFNNLSIEADCEVVHGKPLPTLWNSFKSLLSVFTKLSQCKSQKARLRIVKGVSGVIKPSRMTLLLGPPGSGKTTLLKALAGKLDSSLKVKGEIYYNGRKVENLMPQDTSAYISQYDLHIPEMTVRETIDFSARCQGVESKTEIMMEVIRREKQEGIVPEPDIDTFMKATSISGLERTLQTDYTLKILGLDICADTIVGDAMRRGISGGQKRRLATAEMIVGPKRALFMDEISNGLDTSTTFQIITCLQQLVHITDATALISLLQPAPETFDLFDDIMLYAEGKIVYHGPKSDILTFFEDCGFRCPTRKGVADFLQEVISEKDQIQYWYKTESPYKYISVKEFSQMFNAYCIGRQLNEEFCTANNDRSKQNYTSYSNSSKYSTTKWELLKACMDREVLLMKRNSSVYTFKFVQLFVIALITMTVFLRTRMEVDLEHANYFLGSLFYGIMRIMLNGIAELTMTVSRLSVFYKQRDFNFYPAWIFSVPFAVLKIPLSLAESFAWTALTYYVIGYAPEVERFLRQVLLFFALHQTSLSSFRFIAAICQREVAAIFLGSVLILILLLFGGFVIPEASLPAWLRWGFWASMVSYAEIGVSVNEFLAPRWKKVMSGSSTVSEAALSSHGLNFEDYYYWLSLGVLFGTAVLLNIGFVLALTFMKSPGTHKLIISYEKLHQLQNDEGINGGRDIDKKPQPTTPSLTRATSTETARMALPFDPLILTFQNVQYSVETPLEMRKQGFKDTRLHLLHDITGAFRPGVLTALMGVSGAGKTTLMDVLAGRKVSGYIEGDIRVGGYPKIQEAFARISGYCEQSDIHSPQITVEESLIFSAWLRLPSEIERTTKAEFVKDVIERIELEGIKDTLVGLPGISGLSNEQRKRLTIAVELVSNPSIIFMDEPTSGLDARAAAIVMRAVKNVANTGRTVVCTIHQPSIDIFEAFDELILMKKGGQIIYSGPLGEHSMELINYFEQIPGVPRIKGNYNPATWMLEVTSAALEAQLGLDFSRVYKESPLCMENLEGVQRLSEAPAGSSEIHFPTRYACNSWEQFEACIWKQNLSYWRSPAYNFTRLMLTIISSILLAVLMWQKGQKIYSEQDLINIISSVYVLLQNLAVYNSSVAIPVVATERTVLYRERFAGMYSSWAYSIAKVTIELPYVFLEALFFVVMTYPAIGFYGSATKVLWFFYATFCMLLYYTYLGMFMVSISPNAKLATILAAASFTILNLFSGFLIPGPAIPKWWRWCYWISPTSWTLNALVTPQYGDIGEHITVFGETKPMNSFLENYYGYDRAKLPLIAFLQAAFPVLFASLFAVSIAKLNFQRR
ncbi:hypothetical protein K2173_026916 [Erythroxylum novogranatense]|uniref:ABC transporter domain-containing protein n=1 Tax=Erythroxylum novogranatense TaxID=1862640 RepID=A0AAV8U0C4_9ROSI|nr:hypothetical protein K2173_026916 [Erythroxylum novogranatense]